MQLTSICTPAAQAVSSPVPPKKNKRQTIFFTGESDSFQSTRQSQSVVARKVVKDNIYNHLHFGGGIGEINIRKQNPAEIDRLVSEVLRISVTVKDKTLTGEEFLTGLGKNKLRKSTQNSVSSSSKLSDTEAAESLKAKAEQMRKELDESLGKKTKETTFSKPSQALQRQGLNTAESLFDYDPDLLDKVRTELVKLKIVKLQKVHGREDDIWVFTPTGIAVHDKLKQA